MRFFNVPEWLTALTEKETFHEVCTFAYSDWHRYCNDRCLLDFVAPSGSRDLFDSRTRFLDRLGQSLFISGLG